MCFQIISNIFQGNKKIASLITTTAECGDQSVCLGLDAGLLWSAIKETGLQSTLQVKLPSGHFVEQITWI